MGFAKKAEKVLTNKYFLYLITFLSATNVLGYLAMNKVRPVIFFSLIGLVMTRFSKNMAVVLLVALVSTNLVMTNKIIREGNQGMKKEEIKEEIKEKKQSTEEKKDAFKPNITPAKVTEPRLDYAGSIKSQFSELQELLGEDGIKGLTKDTMDLMKSQQNMIGQMNDVAPMMKQVQDMVKGLGDGNGNMGDIKEMMRQLKGVN